MADLTIYASSVVEAILKVFSATNYISSLNLIP